MFSFGSITRGALLARVQLRGLKDAMELMVNAMPRFVAALGALFLLLYIAAATGVNLFGGALRNRCFSRSTGMLRAAGMRCDWASHCAFCRKSCR